MAPKQNKSYSGPIDANPYYGVSGGQGDNAINADKNGYSFLGEFFDRGLQRQARNTKYYDKVVSRRSDFARQALGQWVDQVTGNDDYSEEQRKTRQTIEKSTDRMIEAMEKSDKFSGEQIEDLKKWVTDTVNKSQGNGSGGRSSKPSSSSSPASGEAESNGNTEGGEENQKDPNEEIKKTAQQWYKSWDSQQKHMSTGEAVLAVCLEQVIDVAKKIETQVRNGRNEASNLYNANVSNVVSRGVTTKTSFAVESTAIGMQLLEDNLFADIKANDVFKGYIDLVNKGYSDKDANTLAYADAITKKIAPYLDTQTTAFKDLQNAFGQTFLMQIQGINNYVQDIAGSAKVFESNINTIITSLEPIQLWSEKQMWGEDELAALDYLVENNGMTQQQAASLIQSALKVTTNQYGSITGGTMAEKVAVATGQTDFGDAITSLLKTGTMGGSSNQVVQGAFLQASGTSGFISENADTSSVWSKYLTGYNKAQNSGLTIEGETAENLEALQSEQLSSTKEIHETLTSNAGSMLSFLQDFAPEVTERLDKIFSIDTAISGITTMIAIAQYRNMLANATSNIIGSALGGGGGIVSAGLSAGKIAAYTGGAALSLAALGAIGWGVGSAIKKNKLGDAKFINSYDVGTDYVKQDQLAMIHEGEAVLTPEENKAYQAGKKNGADLTGSLVNSTITVKVEQEEKNDKLIRELRECTESLIYAIKTYCKSERTFTYDQNTVNLIDESDE